MSVPFSLKHHVFTLCFVFSGVLLQSSFAQMILETRTLEDGSTTTQTGQLVVQGENGIVGVQTPVIDYSWPSGIPIEDVKEIGFNLSLRFEYIREENLSLAEYCFSSIMSHAARDMNVLTESITPPPAPPTMTPVLRVTDTSEMEVDTQCCGQCTASFGDAVSLIVWPQPSNSPERRQAMSRTSGSSSYNSTAEVHPSSTSSLTSRMNTITGGEGAEITSPPALGMPTATLSFASSGVITTASAAPSEGLHSNDTMDAHSNSVVVSNGFTFTSPTVYIAVSTVWGQDLCSGRVDGGVDQVTYHPITLSNLRSQVFVSYTNRAVASVTSPYNIEQQISECSEWSRTGNPHTYKTEDFPNTDQPHNSYIQYSNPCSPWLAFPTELLDVHPAVKSCVGLALLDPPQTLTRWDGLVQRPPGPPGGAPTPETPTPTLEPTQEPLSPVPLVQGIATGVVPEPTEDVDLQVDPLVTSIASPTPLIPPGTSFPSALSTPESPPSPSPIEEISINEQGDVNPPVTATSAAQLPSASLPLQPESVGGSPSTILPVIEAGPSHLPDNSGPTAITTSGSQSSSALSPLEPQTVSLGGLQLTILPIPESATSRLPDDSSSPVDSTSLIDNLLATSSHVQSLPVHVTPSPGDEGGESSVTSLQLSGVTPTAPIEPSPGVQQPPSIVSPIFTPPEVVVSGQTLSPGDGPVTIGTEVVSWAEPSASQGFLVVGTETTAVYVSPVSTDSTLLPGDETDEALEYTNEVVNSLGVIPTSTGMDSIADAIISGLTPVIEGLEGETNLAGEGSSAINGTLEATTSNGFSTVTAAQTSDGVEASIEASATGIATGLANKNGLSWSLVVIGVAARWLG